MQLIVDGKFREDDWKEVERFDPREKSPVLFPYSDDLVKIVGQHIDADLLGLLVQPDIAIDALERFTSRVALIAVEFPNRLDGRGFSLATICRRLGFTGELRACGEFIPDQYPHLKACGFDSVRVPLNTVEKHTELEWRKAFLRFPLRYQDRLTQQSSILARRHPEHPDVSRGVARPVI